MEHQVVDLIVPMNERPPILRLRFRILEERHHVVEVRDLAYWYVCLDVYGLRLHFGDRAEGRDLAVVEA